MDITTDNLIHLRKILKRWESTFPSDSILAREFSVFVHILEKSGSISVENNELRKSLWNGKHVIDRDKKVINALKKGIKYYEDRVFWTQLDMKRKLSLDETINALRETKLFFTNEAFQLDYALTRLQALFRRRLSGKYYLEFSKLLDEYQIQFDKKTLSPIEGTRIITAKIMLFIDRVVDSYLLANSFENGDKS